MRNFIFSLNATLPIFFVMMLGYFFRRTGVISESLAAGMNSFVFKIALPVNLFAELYTVDFFSVWDTSFVLFCFFATLACVGIAVLLSLFLCSAEDRGEFVQASYRSSASLLGMAYIENIYGNAGTGASAAMGSLMMLGAVPLYNVCAVLVLSLSGGSKGRPDRERLKKALVGIVTNPIILGILAGFVWSVLKIPMPEMFGKTFSYIGRLANPMGLLAMGASLNFTAFSEKVRPVLLATFLKLVGFAALGLPAAAALGFRQEKLVAVLIMLGSASTVAGYVMAKSMGHKGIVSSGTVMMTTLLSSLTLTFWLFLLRSRGLI